MSRVLGLCAAACLLTSALAMSQEPEKPAAPVSPSPAGATPPASTPSAAPTNPSGPDANGRYILREGEDVNLRFTQGLSSKTAAEGDPVTFELVDDLRVGDVVVAKAGSKALGEVTVAKKSGMMGQAGDLSLRLDYLKVGDKKVKLRGVKGKEGESGVTGTVVLTVLFGPIGLLKHGKNVEIKEGQSLHAYVADDVALAPVAR